jgi:DNA-binding NarL/FixJ family response regulator
LSICQATPAAPELKRRWACRAISARHPGQKAIIESGFAETDRVREAQHLGAGAYVKRPFLMETFAQAIRNQLEH